MANVYQKYMGEIERSEFKHFYPTSTLNLNAPNKRTDFNIDYGDSFSMSKFQFYISGTLQKADGTNYATNANVKLIDNFVPYLFSRIEVKKHNYLLDEVEYPGITSTVKSIVSYENSDQNMLKNCGFISSCDGSAKNFYVCGNLSHLGLGFFEDVKIPIYKGGFVISFIRDTDTHTVYRWKSMKQDKGQSVPDDTTLPGEGKVFINEFIIRVPLIEFKPTSKISLVKELSDLQTLNFHFRRWQCIRKPGLNGNSCSFDVTNIFRNVQNPTFVLVAFQTTADQVNNSSHFTPANVKNIRIYINDQIYPEELQNLSIDEGNYSIAYEMYRDFKNVYSNNDHMLYEPSKFMMRKCVFVIDTSKQPNNISNARSNIRISVDFTPAVPENTVMYVVIVSHATLSYDLINNVIKEKIND